MTLWAGIDEAGYGPLLGPLVVAGAVFRVPGSVREGVLWDLLDEAVSQHASHRGDRLIVDDSKKVYSPKDGLKRLEEGVLAFVRAASELPRSGGALLNALGGGVPDTLAPWFRSMPDTDLPLGSNMSAVESKASALRESLERSDVEVCGVWAIPVLPKEFNDMVHRTGNKSYLLFQKCGRLLLKTFALGREDACHVLVDRHGGRIRYRKLLRDLHPAMSCDVVREGDDGSVYKIGDQSKPRTVAFKKEGDALALPVALASMTAKYVRELYMAAFNCYWQERLDGLKPTAGYAKDAKRFLSEIGPLIEEDGIDRSSLVRSR